MLFVVKLFPEITIKSRPVRRRFIRMLRRNISKLLKPVDEAVKVSGEWDSLEVETSTDDETMNDSVIETLANTPGITYFLKVRKTPLPDFDGILAQAKAFYGDQMTGKTFAVRCKRLGRHSFRSIDVERHVGAGLNRQTEASGVKLVNPDITVRIDIQDDQLLIVERQYPGMGGFPLGSQDGVLSLISGGFDSSVSSYLCVKRGLMTHYCFFNLGGAAHEVAVKEVALYLWMKYGSSHRVKFVSVPFEGVVQEILEKVDNSQMGVILKRMMLRAATQVAEKLSLQALVTGEAVAQVSSQTLANLAVIDSVTDKLVLRPLSTSDKQDIIDIARRIGTEEFSKNIPEYCGVISVKPTTRARTERIEREESNFDFSVLQESVENAVIRTIDRIAEDQRSAIADEADTGAGEYEQPTLVSVPEPGSVVIDIRHPDEQELRPLRLSEDLQEIAVETIPFYRLRSSAEHLDKARRYLLYCDRGMMSRLHALHLRDQGFSNVAVFEPV